MAALMRLGVPPLETGRRIEWMRTMRSDGSGIYDLDVSRLERHLGHPTVVIPRAELITHLARQLLEGTIQFGRAAIGAAAADGSAILQIDDGSELAAEVVLGADGHRSVVRRFVSDTGPARPTGLIAWQGVQQSSIPLAASSDAYYIRGRNGWFGLMPAGAGRLQWWFDLPEFETATVPANERVAWLQQRFDGWARPVPEVVADLDQASIEPWRYVWHPVPRQLTRGRVVILGDAAHAMPPSLAQGANQTLEDAWVLTDALTQHDDAALALRSYQRRRRHRAAFVARAARSSLALSGLPPWTEMISRRVPVPLGTRAFGAFLKTMSNSL